MTKQNVKKRNFKFRLIPIIIFFMVLMLTVRLKNVFVSFSNPEDNKNLFSNKKAVAADVKQTPSDNKDELMPIGQEFAPGYRLTEENYLEVEKFSQSEIDVLQSLAKRREEIDAREKQLEQQVALLKAAEGQIERKINSLKSYEKNIKELLGEYDKKEQERLENLVNLYSKMKPKDAAVIFDDLEMNILIVLFERMRTQNAAAILSSMSPEKARALTIELADKERSRDNIDFNTDKTILR